MFVGAHTLDQVTKSLHQHTARQHIGQRRYMLAVTVGLIKGLGKSVRYQQGKVGILTLEGRIGIGVAIHRIDAFHILCNHMSVGVHAEGTHLITVLLGAVNQLGLVDHVGDMLKHLGRQFNAHTDIYLIIDQFNAQSLAPLGEPFCTGTTGTGNEPGGGKFLSLFGCNAILMLPFYRNICHGCMETELHTILHISVDILKNSQVVFGAQMLAARLQQVQIML